MKLSAHVEKVPLIHPFHITGYTFTHNDLLVVKLQDGTHVGVGEALGVYYKHDTPYTMLEQVEALRPTLEHGITRKELLELLPPGGARHAIDAALWDLEAKQRDMPVWQLAGMEPPRPLLTTFTLGADEPEVMATEARGFEGVRAIKLKLTDDALNAERVRAVRAACPDAWMMIDANQGFTRETLASVLPAFVEARVAVVEQPFPVGKEDWLDGLDCPIPIALDESIQDHRDLGLAVGRAQVINIKLDKCGGLTEALILAHKAQEMGFKLMVGNMGGSSWSMAPGFVIGSLCTVVDLDGPIYLSADRTPAVSYHDGHIWCPETVWGGPVAA
ncbi:MULTISPECIES: dipeptide epimerase [Dyella]|uniref:Dipeptide epimerase n=2 Tax=Dyella TaxID=231454 RepID=A0A4R0YN47_9GAMM|nr:MULTISPECIES: dipeptide epimerase [Dyella]TBR37010.1 dipeptide epimerase [Dyella terrae]TCI07901.1 dipeptide epimerase [Dyella soli]